MKTEYQRSRAIDTKLEGRVTTKCGVVVTEEDWMNTKESDVSTEWAVNSAIAFRANRLGMIVQLDGLYTDLAITEVPYRVASKETLTEPSDRLTQAELRIKFTPISEAHPPVVIETGEPNNPEYKYIEGGSDPELIKPLFHPLSDLHLSYVFTETPEDLVPLVI